MINLEDNLVLVVASARFDLNTLVSRRSKPPMPFPPHLRTAGSQGSVALRRMTMGWEAAVQHRCGEVLWRPTMRRGVPENAWRIPHRQADRRAEAFVPDVLQPGRLGRTGPPST